MCPSTALFMVLKVVITCLRVLQKVKTRLSARCVFSSFWKDSGHGTALEREEALRERVGGSLVALRGFVPPS